MTPDLTVDVGTLPRLALREALRSRRILLNAHADTLLGHHAFDDHTRQSLLVVLRTVGELGLTYGASLAQIFSTAQDLGLSLCPPDTGPYLRLAMPAQASAPDSVLSAGRAPAAKPGGRD